ncbi:helix-turn-helix domain-containing protein [Aquibacillus albus]|uniref:Transcriptional regulator with XRE-family HTH domain n=1 Tax=Aquibacillus albus TaxID=1168171 RepID=A0ABS2N668_9BACI|nr:helix-turn-helix transcriptional regulator [Aquibacillus albus]MBM7573635.1 transcriptional regulator with XRE-family HTH domain [Aquibacillus albus]
MIRQEQLKAIRLAILKKKKIEVARELNVPRLRITRYETGENKAPREYLEHFSETYGITTETVEKIAELERLLKALNETRNTLNN